MPTTDHRRDGGPDSTAANTAVAALAPIRDFTDIVSIYVQTKKFYVYRDILTKNPGYFSAELDRPDRQWRRKSFTIRVNDIDPNSFAEYLQVLYKSAYVPGFKLRAHQDLYPLAKVLDIWQVAHYSDDVMSKAIVEEALESHWDAMSVEQWHSFYLSVPDSRLAERVLQLQEAYERCKTKFIPFRKQIVTACAKCPPQVFAEVFAGLELGAEFRIEVTKSFAMRYADRASTKKRKVTEERSPMPPAKRQSLMVSLKVPALASPKGQPCGGTGEEG